MSIEDCRFLSITDNLFERLMKNKEVQKEVLEYFKEVLEGWHPEDFSEVDTKAFRDTIFKEHKDELTNEIISDLKKENSDLKEKLQEFRSMKCFQISESDMKKIHEWDRTHECTIKKVNGQKCVGAIDGHLTFMFTPTSLGSFVKVKCACGKELELEYNF